MKPSNFPVDAEVVEIDKNLHLEKNVFYGRFGNDTRKTPDSGGCERYKFQVWGP